MSPVARQHLPAHLQDNFPVVGGENFEGATIDYSALFNNGGLPAQHLTVGPYIELGNFPGFGTNPVAYMDISGGSLTIHFYSAADYSDDRFLFFLNDNYDQVPAVVDWTLENNGGSAAFTEDDIDVTPDGDQVTVDLSGTSFAAGNDIVIRFSFAPSSGGDLLFS
jgi:hypothetical protein